MWGYHNGFTPVFFGKLVDDCASGTSIEGHFGVGVLARFVFYLGAVMMGLMALAVIIGSMFGGSEGQPMSPILTVLCILGFWAVWLLALTLFWWIDSGDIRFMTEFFENVLEATEQPPAGENL